MDLRLMCPLLRRHGSLACFFWVSVVLSDTSVAAFRSPVFLWAASKKPQSFFALSPRTQDSDEHGVLLSGIPEVLSSPVVSLLQVEAAGGEKDESEGEARAPTSESAASESDQSQEQGSSSEAAGGSEEEHGGSASQEVSKADKLRETPETKLRSSKREDSSAEDSTHASSQESSSEEVKPSAAEEASGITASGQSSTKSAPAHGAKASASASEAASKEESRSESTPPEASHKLTTESHVEVPKSERSTPVSIHEVREKEKELKEKTGEAEVSRPSVPPATKTVLQLNFRPSMVIGGGEGDSVDRHVLAEEGGTKWYQVVGKRDLTILKLKPMEGEKILHEESVTHQPS